MTLLSPHSSKGEGKKNWETPLKFTVWRNRLPVRPRSNYRSMESVLCTPPPTHQLTATLLLSHSVVSDSLWPHGLQHARLPCPSPSPGVYSNSCPLSRCCHQTIPSSVVPFSSCLPSFSASGSFPVSWFFTSGGQSIGASTSASVLPMNIQGWLH